MVNSILAYSPAGYVAEISTQSGLIRKISPSFYDQMNNDASRSWLGDFAVQDPVTGLIYLPYLTNYDNEPLWVTLDASLHTWRYGPSVDIEPLFNSLRPAIFSLNTIRNYGSLAIGPGGLYFTFEDWETWYDDPLDPNGSSVRKLYSIRFPNFRSNGEYVLPPLDWLGDGDDESNMAEAPATYNGVMYYTTEGRAVHAVDLTNGRHTLGMNLNDVTYRNDVNFQPWGADYDLSAAAVYKGRVYAYGYDGGFYTPGSAYQSWTNASAIFSCPIGGAGIWPPDGVSYGDIRVEVLWNHFETERPGVEGFSGIAIVDPPYYYFNGGYESRIARYNMDTGHFDNPWTDLQGDPVLRSGPTNGVWDWMLVAAGSQTRSSALTAGALHQTGMRFDSSRPYRSR